MNDEDYLRHMTEILNKKAKIKSKNESSSKSKEKNNQEKLLKKPDKPSESSILPSFLVKDDVEDKAYISDNSDDSNNSRKNRYLQMENDDEDDESSSNEDNFDNQKIKINQKEGVFKLNNERVMKPPTDLHKFFSFDDIKNKQMFHFNNSNANMNQNNVTNQINNPNNMYNLNFQMNNLNLNTVNNNNNNMNPNPQFIENNSTPYINNNNMHEFQINNLNNMNNVQNFNQLSSPQLYINDRVIRLNNNINNNFMMNMNMNMHNNNNQNPQFGNYFGINEQMNNNLCPPPPQQQINVHQINQPSFSPFLNPGPRLSNFNSMTNIPLNYQNQMANLRINNMNDNQFINNQFQNQSQINFTNGYNNLININNQPIQPNNNMLNFNNMNQINPMNSNINNINSNINNLNNINNMNINNQDLNAILQNKQINPNIFSINTPQTIASPNQNQSLNINPCQNVENNDQDIPNSKATPQKKPKKKTKKSTTDNENPLTINSLLCLSDNDLYQFIITQKGSRDVQNVLKKVSENEVDKLINKISSKLSDIMIDKYGNYFSQKLIQICSPNQRVMILKSIKDRFVEIAIDPFGTHPLQSFIEIINMPNEREILLSCIENNELELSLDSKGTHIIQKFICCSSEEERGNVGQNILKILPKLINDSFGVCVLIKLIKHSNDKKIKETIIDYIDQNNALSFIQNPYSNYVIQALFNPNDISLCKNILDTIVDHFFSLSMQKFSSNVVENCIRFSDESIVKKIYKDIMDTGKLGSMLNNTYGNFVIEKLIGRLNKEERNEMLKEIIKLGKEKNLSNSILNLLNK